MKGKRVLITGATNGIGKQAALELATMGAAVTIVGRDESKTRQVSSDLTTQSGNTNIDFLIADLSSMAETRRIAQEYLAKYQRLDVLLNNAGAMFSRFQTSADGYEMTFALNHFSYYLLTVLLLNNIKATAQEHGDARIINVSSGAHKSGALKQGLWLDDLRSEAGFRGMGGFANYGASKLANILFTYELARRLEVAGVTVNALHPGFVNTGFGHNMSGALGGFIKGSQRLFARSPRKGAETLVYLASSAEVAGITGKYWLDMKQARSSDISYDREQQSKLWDFSAAATGVG